MCEAWCMGHASMGKTCGVGWCQLRSIYKYNRRGCMYGESPCMKWNEMKLVLKSRKPNMLMELKVGPRATAHTRLRACDHYTSSTLNSGKGGADLRLLHTMLEGLTEYVPSYVASDWSRFLITWTTLKNHLLEVRRRNTKLGTMTLWTLITLLFYHVWGSAWIKIHWNSIWLRTQSHMASHYIWGSWPH